MFLFKQTTANFRNINILFAPGLPGEMTQRAIFDDLSALGCDIYSFYYSGTYEQVGIFDLEQANKDLVNAIQEMEDKKPPFIILGYSFSTYFLQKIDLAQYSNILGLSMFSPIMGLDPKSIKADFFEELETLHKDSTQPFKCNLELLKTQIPASELNFDYSLSKFALYNFPVTFAYSLNDTLINVDTINYKLQNYRIQHTYNKFLVWDSSEGYHRLDTYYNNSMKAYFEGLFIAADLKRLIDDEVYVYF